MPSTEQKQLVVHVIAATSDGYNNASGIVVAPGRVLTVGHVLEGAVSDPQIRFCALEPERGKWIPAKSCWDGGKLGRDIAVLDFAPEALAPASQDICGILSRRLINTGPWGSHARWGSFGLPAFAWRTQTGVTNPSPEPTTLTGSVGSANPVNGDLDVCADALPADATKWMGASGSGVFVDHGLRAIIVEAITDVPNKLRALHIPPLFALPGFRDAIRWSSERDWFPLLARIVGELLKKQELRPLCEALAADLALENTAPNVVATALLALPAYELLLSANRVAHGLVGDGEQGHDDAAYRLASVLDEIVEAGLAGKLGAALAGRVVIASRAGAGEDLIKLPTMNVVLAEYYNAGLDGRSAKLRAIPPDDQGGGQELWSELRQEYPDWPEVCVPLNPVIGYGADPMDWAKTALSHLAQALRVPEIERRQSNTARLAEAVNDSLQALAQTPGRAVPKRWYLVYAEGQAAEPAQALKRLLPELRVCVIGKAEDREERRTESQLRTAVNEFHERNRKRANRR